MLASRRISKIPARLLRAGWLSFLAALFLPAHALADTKPAWALSLDRPVRWFRGAPEGVLLVGGSVPELERDQEEALVRRVGHRVRRLRQQRLGSRHQAREQLGHGQREVGGDGDGDGLLALGGHRLGISLRIPGPNRTRAWGGRNRRQRGRSWAGYGTKTNCCAGRVSRRISPGRVPNPQPSSSSHTPVIWPQAGHMASPQDVSSGRAWFRPVTKALSTPAAACVVPQEGQAALYSNNIAQTLSEQTLNCFSDGGLRSPWG